MATDPLGQLADELEATSPGFAGRIRDLSARLATHPVASELVTALGDTLRRIVELEGPGRDAGLALVLLSPEEVELAGAEGLRAWSESVLAIGRTSLRAAQGFGAASLVALGRTAGAARRIADAGQAVAALAERHPADPLITRFAAEAGRCLAERGGAVVAAWAEYCEAAVLGRPRLTRGLEELPSLPGLRDEELAAAVELAALAARRDVEAGERIFRAAPHALERVSAQSRESVVALARLLTDAPSALLDLLEIVAPVLRRLERPARWMVLDLACEVARGAPAAAPRFFRSVLRVGEAVGYGHDLEAFVREGLALAERRPAAAEAFFSLETRGARAFLRRHDAAVLLEDVEITLRGYLQLIEGERFSLVGVEESGLFPFIVTDAATVPVSRRVQLFPIWEENFALVKLQATLATLWRHEGTLDFRIGTWLGGDQPGGIQEFCDRFAMPDAARGIFVHLETVRLMPVLASRYPGLAADLAALRERVFPGDRVASALGAPGAMLYLALGGSAERVEWEGAAVEPLRKLAAAATRGEATVYDTATCTAAYCELLAEGELVRIHSLEDFLADDPMLAYLLELEEDGLPGGPDAPTDFARPEESHSGEGRRSDETAEGAAASPELLRAYLEQHPDLEVQRAEGPIDAMGLFVAGLVGGGAKRDDARRSGESPDSIFAASRQGREARGVHLHDEWDYRIEDYRVDWCQVHDVVLEGDSGEFFSQALARHRELLPEVRRQFQRVKPEGYRVIRGLLDGEDFDLNAVVTARSDMRARRDPSSKLYTARKREERDVATLFLLDMSASTDEETEPADPRSSEGESRGQGRRVIDIQKEALVIMAQALEEIGDLYAIYGFSGHGRKLVELFTIKAFDEPLSVAVRGRIGSIEPQRSTRMGAALRQARTCFRSLAVRGKHLILLSDGFPQDFDYGDDRRSNTYGLKDTAMALREAEQAGISTFCITVDRAGNDYLREMCEERRYLVIDEIDALPRELPKIYSEATRGSA